MTEVVSRVLRDRLADYAVRVSFERGRRPDPPLTDAERGDLAAAEPAWGVPRGILLLIDRLMTLISPAVRPTADGGSAVMRPDGEGDWRE